MLRLKDGQIDIWESILPEPLRTLPEELAKVDKLLDDDRFLEPFLKNHHKRMGRPTYPIEKYLRLMYLKHRYNLGYESLIQEVGDSFTWRRFCRIAIDEEMPDPTTLIKARKRYGDEVIEQLNEALIQKLKEENRIKHRKLRTDTTVIESDIHHPTDATLMQDGVKVLTRIIKKMRSYASHATREFTDRTGEIKKKVLAIAKFLRRRTHQSWEEIDTITSQIIAISEDVCTKAKSVLEQTKDKGRTHVKQLKNQLEQAITVTDRLVDQAKQVVSGNRIVPDRMVSFFDPQARPIKKGKLSKTTEFGYKVRIDETENGFVTGYEVYQGNPSDDELLIPAVKHHIKQFSEVPHAVATDRGFGSKKNDKDLAELKVRHASVPRRGKKSKKRMEQESQPWFQDLQRYRAAGEAKISLLKRRYGLGRSRYRGYSGTNSWVGMGILAHNLRRAALAA